MGQSESTVSNSGDPDMLAVPPTKAKVPGTRMNKAPETHKGTYESLGAGIVRHTHGG